MQRLQKLSGPLRALVYVAVAAAILAVAAGVGATVALMVGSGGGSPEGAKSQHAGEAKHEQAGKQEAASNRQSEAEYLGKVGDIQNGSVEASLDSNGKLLRYDALTTDDIAQMKANYAALTDYASRAKGLDPPAKYEPQHEVFVRAIDELRDADGLAYQLIANPASATEADFKTYDGHISRATDYLKRSNEMLGRDYKTTAAAQKVSLG